MAPSLTFSLLFALLSLSSLSSATSPGRIGVNYGRLADNLPSPSQVVSLLHSQHLSSAKIFDSDPSVLSAFSNSNISLSVSLPNEILSSAASNSSFTSSWLRQNILPFYPATNITSISVGNEVFTNPQNTPFLLPALQNLHSSLQSLNLHNSIKISSPLALSALNSSFPPSSGAFNPDLIPSVISPILAFLRQTSSFLMVNAYPFLAYTANSDQISLSYALFHDNPGVVDAGNSLKYTNLFDAQIDAVYAAMAALNYSDIPVVVTETGWPSKGDDNEAGATAANAAAYNGNLVRRVLSGGGTPLRPNQPLEVYLFALFNEDQKPGPTSERNFGLFYPDQKKVYEISLSGGAAVSSVDNSSEVVVAAAPASGVVVRAGQTWCVANGKAKDEKLQEALDYACGEGGADCGPIQDGATCYNPNTLEAHASYAFNSYYQRNARASGTCDFGGAAYVVTQTPRYGSCSFPMGN